jgi:hypothetical protein
MHHPSLTHAAGALRATGSRVIQSTAAVIRQQGD